MPGTALSTAIARLVKANREKHKLIIALRRQLTKAKQDLTEARQVISEMEYARAHAGPEIEPPAVSEVILHPPIIEEVIISRPLRDQIIDDIPCNLPVSDSKLRRYSQHFYSAMLVLSSISPKAYRWVRQLLPLSCITSRYSKFGSAIQKQQHALLAKDVDFSNQDGTNRRTFVEFSVIIKRRESA